jgi:hypothetical protein
MGDKAGISSSKMLRSLGYSMTGGNIWEITGFAKGSFEFLEFEDETGSYFFLLIELMLL